MNRIKKGLFASVWVLAGLIPKVEATTSFASKQYTENIRGHHVITQGLVTSTNNSIYGDSEDSISAEYSQWTSNFSVQFAPQVRLSTQGIFRNVGGVDESEFKLDFTFLDYSFFQSFTSSAGLRLGRFKNPYGIYNETSDILFTRPSIMLPQSSYPDESRNILLSSDGLLFYGDHFTDYGQFNFQLGYGIPRMEEEFNIPGVEAGESGEPENERMLVWSAFYETASGAWRFGFSGLNGRSDYTYNPDTLPNSIIASNLSALGIPASLVDTVTSLLVVGDVSGPIEIDVYLLSVQYMRETWTLTSEFSLFHYTTDLSLLPISILPNPLGIEYEDSVDINADIWGYTAYLQFEKQLTENTYGFLRYDMSIDNRDDKDGKEVERIFGVPAYTAFAYDYSIGTRWEITPQWLFNAEIHYVDGVTWIPEINDAEAERYWSLGMVTLSYRF